MRKLNPTTKRQIEPSKACIAIALFTLECRTLHFHLDAKNKAEGAFGDDIEHDAISNLKFSNFANLVKPTSFQRFPTMSSSSSSSSSSLASSTVSSPSPAASKASFDVPSVENLQDENFEGVERRRSKRVGSILKSGDRSRFYKEK